MPYRLECDSTPEATVEKARCIAGRIVFEKMADWCVNNTDDMFTARDDIQRLVQLRLDAGENVVADTLLAELEKGEG